MYLFLVSNKKGSYCLPHSSVIITHFVCLIKGLHCYTRDFYCIFQLVTLFSSLTYFHPIKVGPYILVFIIRAPKFIKKAKMKFFTASLLTVACLAGQALAGKSGGKSGSSSSGTSTDTSSDTSGTTVRMSQTFFIENNYTFF